MGEVNSTESGIRPRQARRVGHDCWPPLWPLPDITDPDSPDPGDETQAGPGPLARDGA